ncbi:MAG: twin-arginine translocation signal domain-containing protein, partial [Alphaproteobacteria bacterium]|nr:twin-arginine translocation signal domain-containing protein [Alphaproteobacteria bacterium]
MSTAEHAETNRRDFLYIATGAVGAVGVALAAWPFINQMNPDASVLALASVEIDLAPV